MKKKVIVGASVAGVAVVGIAGAYILKKHPLECAIAKKVIEKVKKTKEA